MQNARLSLLQIHLAVLLASGAGLFAKFVSVSPAVITCARTFFGCRALAAVALLMKASFRIQSRKDFLMLAFSGEMLALHWFAFSFPSKFRQSPSGYWRSHRFLCL